LLPPTHACRAAKALPQIAAAMAVALSCPKKLPQRPLAKPRALSAFFSGAPAIVIGGNFAKPQTLQFGHP